MRVSSNKYYKISACEVGTLEFEDGVGFGFESKLIFVQIDIRMWQIVQVSNHEQSREDTPKILLRTVFEFSQNRNFFQGLNGNDKYIGWDQLAEEFHFQPNVFPINSIGNRRTFSNFQTEKYPNMVFFEDLGRKRNCWFVPGVIDTTDPLVIKLKSQLLFQHLLIINKSFKSLLQMKIFFLNSTQLVLLFLIYLTELS